MTLGHPITPPHDSRPPPPPPTFHHDGEREHAASQSSRRTPHGVTSVARLPSYQSSAQSAVWSLSVSVSAAPQPHTPGAILSASAGLHAPYHNTNTQRPKEHALTPSPQKHLCSSSRNGQHWRRADQHPWPALRTAGDTQHRSYQASLQSAVWSPSVSVSATPQPQAPATVLAASVGLYMNTGQKCAHDAPRMRTGNPHTLIPKEQDAQHFLRRMHTAQAQTPLDAARTIHPHSRESYRRHYPCQPRRSRRRRPRSCRG